MVACQLLFILNTVYCPVFIVCVYSSDLVWHKL